jgi:hypothetical protein
VIFSDIESDFSKLPNKMPVSMLNIGDKPVGKSSEFNLVIALFSVHAHISLLIFQEKIMANTNLGFLSLGEVIFDSGTLQGGFGIRTDTYTFRTGSVVANVGMASSSSSSTPIALTLFKDNDADGIIDSGDTLVRNAGIGTVRTLNSNLVEGSYIARLTSSLDTGYNFTIGRASSGAANPLAGKEISLGTIAQDLRKSGSVNDKDTADNFAFTLDGNSSLDIGVRELGKQKGNVNIRVVQDLNGNGAVERNEIVAKGISTLKGNLDTIAGLKEAGDYILQVCQSKGNTRFQVNFEHSPITA